MKRIFFIVALLPFLVKAQSINNQKVRWMQPIYMGSNSVSSANSSSDTGFFFFDRADSVLYFKYKGAARAIGYAGSIPNVGQQITDSLKALVRLRASGSGGIDVQNSSGTSVANFGSGGSTNISLNGSTNVNARFSVTDSIVGVNQRLSNSLLVATNIRSGGSTPSVLEGDAGTYPRWQFTVNTKTWEHGYRSGTTAYEIREDGNTRFAITNGGAVSMGATTVSGALTATAQGNNIAQSVDSAITGTSYTLVLGDAGYFKRVTNSSAVTITIPENSSVAFPVGTTIILQQQGTGQITISPASSNVSLESPDGALKSRVRYSKLTLLKVNTNRWDIGGDLTN